MRKHMCTKLGCFAAVLKDGLCAVHYWWQRMVDAGVWPDKKEPPKQQRLKFRLWIDQQQQCRYCGKKLGFRESTIDHVIPRGKGGKSTFGNMVIACRRCNEDKGSKIWL